MHGIGPEVGGVHGRARRARGGPAAATGPPRRGGRRRAGVIGAGAGRTRGGPDGARAPGRGTAAAAVAGGTRAAGALVDLRLQGRAQRAALLGLVVGVPEVLDVVDRPPEMVAAQPLDGADAQGVVAGAGQGPAVGVEGRDEHDEDGDQGDPALGRAFGRVPPVAGRDPLAAGTPAPSRSEVCARSVLIGASGRCPARRA